MNQEFITKALKRFDEYKTAKQLLIRRIAEDELRYRQEYNVTDDTPTTGFIISAVENKYADGVAAYPIPIIEPREPGDILTAEVLTKILPAQLDECGFKSTYKKNYKRKLKYGTSIYGIFYDGEQILINPIDLVSFYADMNVDDIQDSQFVFVESAIDNEILKLEFPEHASEFEGDAVINGAEGSMVVKDRSIIVDCYYKKAIRDKDGRIKYAVHLIKLCNGALLCSSEDDFSEGIYDHGLYPFVLDNLYPIESCPFGFGIIDIIKGTQDYIDSLDSIILKNAKTSGKQRFIIKDQGSINIDEFSDFDNDIIHSAGSIQDDSVKAFQAASLPAFIMNHRLQKIEELKEIAGNREFQQGGVYGGVTSGTAIKALQETGNKLSNAMINGTYDAFERAVYMVIELMRQFYDEQRIYRIAGDELEAKFESFSGDMLYRIRRDALGMVIDKRPVAFDISVRAKNEQLSEVEEIKNDN